MTDFVVCFLIVIDHILQKKLWKKLQKKILIQSVAKNTTRALQNDIGPSFTFSIYDQKATQMLQEGQLFTQIEVIVGNTNSSDAIKSRYDDVLVSFVNIYVLLAANYVTIQYKCPNG